MNVNSVGIAILLALTLTDPAGSDTGTSDSRNNLITSLLIASTPRGPLHTARTIRTEAFGKDTFDRVENTNTSVASLKDLFDWPFFAVKALSSSLHKSQVDVVKLLYVRLEQLTVTTSFS